MSVQLEQELELRGPLDLLRAADEAEEVLILSYTANLDYFEKFVLTETRRLQAITTIISDPSKLVADPLAVNGAGVRYTSAFAACPGGTAFHPKLLVIVGHEKATVAIGSGNITLAGWHGSEEIWTAFHADEGRGPGAVQGASRFLRQLMEGSVRLSSEAILRLRRTAELLEGLDGTDSGPRVVSTFDGPIIEELPNGPVEELVLYSPFFDADLSALRAVHERLRPQKTTIYVQARTSVDGDALSRWATVNGARILWCQNGAYRHGKLIEWSSDGIRSALTGSANLSTPALLLGIGDTGRPANCELGVIGTIGESLAPPEVKAPEGSIGSLTFTSDSSSSGAAGIVLLGATVVENGGLVIELSRELEVVARVQTYDPTKEWLSVTGLSDLTPGAREFKFSVPSLSPGSAIRLKSEKGVSNEVFISDPRRAQRKPIKRVGPEIGSPEEFIEDGDLSALFELAELMRPAFLKSGLMVSKVKGSEGASSDEEDSLSPAPGQTLADYLAVTPAVLPDPVVFWSLSLPAVPGLGVDPGLEGAGGMLTNEVGDEAADSGEALEEAAPPKPADVMRRSSENHRRRLRRFCEKALELASEWPNIFKAFIAKFVLTGIASDLWPDEEDRARILVSLVSCLAHPRDEPTEEEQMAIACSAAIALFILRSEVPKLSVNDEANVRFRFAVKVASDVIVDLDLETLNELVSGLGTAEAVAVEGEAVKDFVRFVLDPPSSNEAAISLLWEEASVEAKEEAGAIVLARLLPKSYEYELLRLAAFVEGSACVVRGRTEKGLTVVCVWDDPFLLLVGEGQFGQMGRLYVGPAASPGTIVAGWDFGAPLRDNLPHLAGSWMPGEEPPSEALPLLSRLGS